MFLGIRILRGRVTATLSAPLTENLWTAPEHLYNRDFPRSKAGDVYGFGIILQEIVTRNLPFGMYEDLDPKGNFLSILKFTFKCLTIACCYELLS